MAHRKRALSFVSEEKEEQEATAAAAAAKVVKKAAACSGCLCSDREDVFTAVGECPMFIGSWAAYPPLDPERPSNLMPFQGASATSHTMQLHQIVQGFSALDMQEQLLQQNAGEPFTLTPVPLLHLVAEYAEATLEDVFRFDADYRSRRRRDRRGQEEPEEEEKQAVMVDFSVPVRNLEHRGMRYAMPTVAFLCSTCAEHYLDRKHPHRPIELGLFDDGLPEHCVADGRYHCNWHLWPDPVSTLHQIRAKARILWPCVCDSFADEDGEE